jgi:hypothetical protein
VTCLTRPKVARSSSRFKRLTRRRRQVLISLNLNLQPSSVFSVLVRQGVLVQ